MTEQPASLSRRTAIAGAGAVAVTGAALAACGGEESASEPPAPGTVLGAAEEVEVGGGKIFKDGGTVVVQQAEGTFTGLSAVCTHQGCLVDNITDDTINCKCHGSKFNLDGSVASGPAKEPLPARKVSVNDKGELVTG